MMRFLRPVRAMLGRDARLLWYRLPSVLICFLLTAVLSVGGASLLSKNTELSAISIPVALVDEDDTKTSRFAIRLVENSDMVGSLNFTHAERAAAMEGVKNGTYLAAIVLPADYADSIMYGKPVNAELFLSPSAEGYSDLVERLAHSGEELLEAGQLGIFAGEHLIYDAYPEQYSAYLDYVNILYLADAFSQSAVTVKEAPWCDTGVSSQAWYFLCWLGCCLLMISLFFAFLGEFSEKHYRLLRAAGFRSAAFCLPKLLLTLTVQLIFGTSAIVIFQKMLPGIPVINLPGAFLGILLMSVFGLCAVICFSSRLQAVVITGTAVVNLVLCGVIIPRMELPAALTKIGDCLPIGLFARLVSGNFSGFLFACIWIILAAGIVCGIVTYRFEKGGMRVE